MVKRLIRRVLANNRYRNILSDVKYEMLLSLRLGPDCATSPLPKCMGVVSTDLGAGVMVERISDRTGGLARTLSDLCASNEMDRDLLCHLNNLVAKLFDMHIVACDLHAANIVFGQRHGKDAFFVVDGYGEHTVIPVRSLSQRLNKYYLRKGMVVIASSTGLAWSAEDRKFSIST